MNSEGTFTSMTEHARIHFMTAYSPYFAQKLSMMPPDAFEPSDMTKPRLFLEEGKEDDRRLVSRRKGLYWASWKRTGIGMCGSVSVSVC